MLTVNIERILPFWASTAPKTPMERIGALLMGIATIFSTAFILMTIANASINAWTSSGVAGSAFGICIILMLLPIGLAHLLAALLPHIFDPWLRKPIGRIEEVNARMADRIRDMYLVMGWFALIGAVALLVYYLATLNGPPRTSVWLLFSR
jgi:hypothetical protein